MPRAMDRNIIPCRLFCQIGTALLVISMTGCSELNSFRRPSEAPKLGGMQPSGHDPYIAAHTPKTTDNSTPDLKPDFQATPRNALAAKDIEQSSNVKAGANTGARSTAHPADNTLGVDLGPPVSGPDLSAPLSLDKPATRPKPNADSLAKSTTKPALDPPSRVAQAPKIDTRAVLDLSKAKMAKLSTYQVKINRQERVASGLQAPEDVLLSIRRQPQAVRLEWTVGPHKGREVIFAANDPSGMMYVHSGDSIVPVPDLPFPPTSPLVMRNSRHPITEAGFDAILWNIEQSLASKDPRSKNTYEGIETPKAIGRPCHKLARVTPEGERWLVYIDMENLFPTVVEAKDSAGELLERYIFTDVQVDPAQLASNDAFDRKVRFGGSAGFLGRLARGNGGDAKTTATPVQK